MSIWHELLRTAIHSPSPHNVQPWRVKIVSDSEAELYIDSTRTLPKEDLTGSFIISTMGMFIEALDILASNRDLRVDFKYLIEPREIVPVILSTTKRELIPFARLMLSSDNRTKERYDKELFYKRRTSRLHLRKQLVDDASLNALRDIGCDRGQKFSVTVDSAQIEQLLQLNTIALFEDLNSIDYHDEIVGWFRYTKKQSLNNLDGLDARCMNTSPLNYWFIAHIPRLLLLPLAGRVMAKVYRYQLGEIPTLGMISGKFWEPESGVDAGRFLMRFWLETARLGLFIHPFGNLVTNRRAAAAVEDELGIKNILLIFKIGYSDEPPKSHRLPIERILV